LAALAGSAAFGLIAHRTWAWAGLAISPITLFLLAAITRLLTTVDRMTILLGVVVPAMAAVWASVGITAREGLSWGRPAEG